MSLIWPGMLWLLLLLPLCILGYAVLQRRRQRALRHGTLGQVMEAGQSGSGRGRRRHVAPALFLLALAILVGALARPQMALSLPQLTGTVILAFDVSGSMAADDLKPTRMEAAKAAAREFIQHQPATVQVGIVAFSDNGFTVQPPTSDQGALLTAIGRLTPQRGTSLASGILAALNTIAVSEGPAPSHGFYSNLTPAPTPSPTPVPAGTHTPNVIILLTDGENNESPDPLTAAQTAADRGVRINTVGLGSAAGSALHIEGFTILSKLNEPLLQQISQTTGGTYYTASSEQELSAIYSHLVPQLVVKSTQTEVTSLFAGAGMLVLLVGGVFSLRWLGRLP